MTAKKQITPEDMARFVAQMTSASNRIGEAIQRVAKAASAASAVFWANFRPRYVLPMVPAHAFTPNFDLACTRCALLPEEH